MNLTKIKKYLTRDIIITLFVNLFLADMFVSGTWLIPFVLLNYYGGAPFIENHSLFFALIMYLLLVLKPISLPILYTFFQKKSKDEVVQRFIYLLKNSKAMKRKVLLLSIIPSIIDYFCDWSGFDFTLKRLLDLVLHFHQFILVSIVYGLFGSYLVLYLYWYVEDKIKNYISKPNTLLSKFIILFKSMN